MTSNENGKVVDLLQNIWEEMKTVNSRINTTNERLDTLRTELRTEIAELRTEMHQGFEKLSLRIDNVLLGEHRREHLDLRDRVVRIETHVGLLPRP